MSLNRIACRPLHRPRTLFLRASRSRTNFRCLSTSFAHRSILGLNYYDIQSRNGNPIINQQTGEIKQHAVPQNQDWNGRYQARLDKYPLGIPRGPTRRQIEQRREDERNDPNRIKVYPSTVPSARARCRDPLAAVTDTQLSVLDPTGARTKLFSKTNPEAARVGDILLVRTRDGDPFAGVCINIRRRGIDTGIMLRDQATRVGVEMWFKIYSPNVEGVEIVQRKAKRARRAKLYYMRQPKHDFGSTHNVVQQYLRQRSVLRSGGQARGRDANAGGRKKKK